jgi:single-strand DNA-binding protein
MANFNKVILAGNLTRDPQLSFLPDNTPVCECGIAVNRKWRTPDGQNREEVCFVDFSIFRRQAETFNQYMTKGRSVLIEGYLKYRQWDAKDGTKRNKLSVIVHNFQFLGEPGGNRAGGGAYGARPAGAPARAPASAPAATSRQYDEPAPAEYPQEDYGPPAEEQPPPAEESPPSGSEIPF